MIPSIRFPFLVIALSFSFYSISQSNKFTAGIQYNLFTIENQIHQDLDISNRILTPLDSSQMRMITDGFIAHVKQKKAVKNFEFNSLSSQGYMEVERSVQKLMNGKYQNIGGMYLDTSKLKGVIQNKNDSLFQNGELIMSRQNVFIQPETLETLDLETGLIYISFSDSNLLINEYAASLDFIENWTYDPETGVFHKNSEYLGLNYSMFNPQTDSYQGQIPFLSFQTTKEINAKSKKYKLIKKDVISDVLISCDEYSCGEQSTSAEAINYLEPSKRSKLILLILRDLYSGKLALYEYSQNDATDIDFNKEIKDPMIWFNKLERNVIAWTINPSTGMEETTEYKEKARIMDIVGIRFIEDWYFSTEGFDLKKVVKGISFLEFNRIEKTAEIDGLKPISPYIIQFSTN